MSGFPDFSSEAGRALLYPNVRFDNRERVILASAKQYIDAHSSGFSGNPSIVLVTDGAGAPTSSTVSTTTLTYLDATSSIQTQLNAKASTAYVDAAIQGITAKPAVFCATTANITLSGEQTLDGILTSNSRVLVKNQSTTSQNGIYVSATGSWTRATDMDTWAEVPGIFAFIEEGTTLGDTGWVCTADPGGTLGTTAITFTQFSSAGSYSAGTGLTLTGTVFSQTALTAGKAVVSDGSGNYAAATTTSTQIGYLSGATGTTGTTSTNIVYSTSPTLVTPILGTPQSVNLSNATALPLTAVTGLGTGVSTFLATPSSANLLSALTTSTGTNNVVFSTSPTLVTPILGVATATSINKMAITAPATSSTLAVADGKTLTTSNTLTLTGTDGSSAAFGTGGTVAYTGNNLSVFAATTSAQLAGVLSDETGSGSSVFATSPTLVTPNLGIPNSVTLTNATGLPVSSGVSGLAANMATFLGTPSSANLAATVTDETGSGGLVFAISPTLVTPALGTPSALVLTNAIGTPSAIGLANGTGLPVATGISGLATGIATFLATPSSANLAAAVTNETGTGALVFATNPALTTPDLGTPSAVVLTNATGTAASLTAGTVTTNANLTGHITSTGNAAVLGSFTSAQLATALTDETGSGAAVFATSPTLVTPVLGTPASGNATNMTGTTTPTASKIAAWDTNANMSANSLIEGYTTTATAAGTTTLTVASTYQQFFTGATTQTVVLPVASTLVLGQQFFISNASSGVVTVQSSGANTIQAMATNTFATYTCILTSGTGTVSWQLSYTTAGGSSTSTPTASTAAAWDTNVNMSANSFINGRAAIVTSNGTTTLTVASARLQVLTGSSAHTVKLPVTSTLVLGQQFEFINTSSSANITIQSSDTSSVAILPALTTRYVVTCVNTGVTDQTGWVFDKVLTGNSGATNGNVYTVANGGYGVNVNTQTSSTPNSGNIVKWGAEQQLNATMFMPALTSTATAAGTTTMTGFSSQIQVWTGTSAQTIKLPSTAATEYAAGMYLDFVNNSTSALTIQTSTAVALLVMAPNTRAKFVIVSIANNTAASWQVIYTNNNKLAQTQISRLRSAATSLTTATTVNVCNTTTKLTLPAGDWVIYGTVAFTAAAGTTVSLLNVGVSKTSATLPAADTTGVPTAGEYMATDALPALVLAGDYTIPLQPVPVSLTASTDYYLVAQGTFGVSTLSVFGSMYAVPG